MAAALGALGPALIWSVGIVFAAHVARDLRPTLTLAWVTPIGLVVLVPVLVAAGHVHLQAAAVSWLPLGDAGNAGGLLILCHARHIGQMGAIMPDCLHRGRDRRRDSDRGRRVDQRHRRGGPRRHCGRSGDDRDRAPAADRGGPPVGEKPAPAEAPAPAANPPARGAAVVTPCGHTDRRAAAWVVAGALQLGVSLYGTGAGTLLPTAWAVLPAG